MLLRELPRCGRRLPWYTAHDLTTGPSGGTLFATIPADLPRAGGPGYPQLFFFAHNVTWRPAFNWAASPGLATGQLTIPAGAEGRVEEKPRGGRRPSRRTEAAVPAGSGQRAVPLPVVATASCQDGELTYTFPN